MSCRSWTGAATDRACARAKNWGKCGRAWSAGIFYRVLNTPERIDVIEKMGHLDREDADFLREAATFYRAVDHGQRVSTGHAEGSLPTSPAQFEVLTNLVKRWTPEHLHQQRIDATLGETPWKTG